jgi:ribosomal protein L7Ae-like RNA K-turn-binding protein
LINQNKVLGLLGIATKAGKITCGTDAVLEEIKKKKAKIVLVAEDASNRTKENFQHLCENENIPIAIFGNIEDVSKAIGKQNKAVVCIKDKNLSEEIYKIIMGGEAIG